MDDPHLLPEEVLRKKVDGDHAQEPRTEEEGPPALLLACGCVGPAPTAGSAI